MFALSTLPLYREFNDLLDYSTLFYDSVKPINLIKSDGIYMLEIEVPGFRREDLNIEISNGSLYISGKIEKDGKVIRKVERSYLLDKSIDIESIESTLDLGILNIKFKQKEKQYKRITIK